MSAVDTLRRWLAGRDKLAIDLPTAEARLVELETNPPSSADPAQHTAEAAKAEAAQRKEDNDAEHAAEDKAAKADQKLARDLDVALRRAAGLRDQLAASVNRTAEYNSRRGDRPYIADAEDRARRIPAKIVPPSYRDEIVWEDASGLRPSLFRRNENGEMVPQAGGFTRKTVKVCQSPERVEPARMPERYVDALKLVDLEGRPL